MGAVTGKGLYDLIREEFGLRLTFLMMALLLIVNLTNVTSEFAGIAASLEVFHISRYISVPLCALAVWLLVVKGNYRSVEKIFLFACVFYISYIISPFLGSRIGKKPSSIASSPSCYWNRLYLHAARDDRHHHRALDAVLSASRRGRKGRIREGLRRIARRSDLRMHHDRRGRVFHHRGLRERNL